MGVSLARWVCGSWSQRIGMVQLSESVIEKVVKMGMELSKTTPKTTRNHFYCRSIGMGESQYMRPSDYRRFIWGERERDFWNRYMGHNGHPVPRRTHYEYHHGCTIEYGVNDEEPSRTIHQEETASSGGLLFKYPYVTSHCGVGGERETGAFLGQVLFDPVTRTPISGR